MDDSFGQLLAAQPSGQPDQPQPKQRRPHRARKDYTNLDKVFDSLDDLKTALRQHIDNATNQAIPQYVSCAMTLALTATLPLKSPLEGPYAQGGPNFLPLDVLAGAPNDGDDNAAADRSPLKSIYELVNITDLKERQIWQRAAAKGIVTAVQNLDGYKYCFNNNWTSKDDDGYRYSYTCLDSLENKDRHANGFRATNAAKRRPGANTRGVRKPTYDCKGQIAVKFSGVRQSVEVVYKHHPIHKTVAERKPPPRKDSKRRSQNEDQGGDDSPSFDFSNDRDDQAAVFHHETNRAVNMVPANPLQQDSFVDEPQQSPYSGLGEQQQASSKARRKTKDAGQTHPKRQKNTHPTETVPEDRPLSLAELLQQSMPQPSPIQSVPTLAPEYPPPPSVWNMPTPAHPGQMGHYRPVAPMPPPASLPIQPTHQPAQPQDVGRFSKLSVPCFKCKATHVEVCLSQIRIWNPLILCSATVDSPSVAPVSPEVQSAIILRYSDSIRRHWRVNGSKVKHK